MKKINRLYCQSCAIQFDFFSACKKHMYGNEHKQRIAKLFQTAPYKGAVHFPQFVIQEYLIKPTRPHPIVGLQFVTSCIETAFGNPPIYLCHLCQDKCPSSQIVSHLTSAEHYHAYFAYVNPEKLPFGWMSSVEKVPETRVAADLEERHSGTGVLRVLDLPNPVFTAIVEAVYSQAMKEIYSTDDLRQCLEVEGLEQVTVQKYHKQPSRTYPLLGLQFLVEYRSTGSRSACGYLCLLCKKRVRQNQATAHVISFDHIFWYLDSVHPLSLKSKSSYSLYSPLFRTMILDLCEQAGQLAPSEDVQVMNLDAEVFVKVEALSFSNALKELQGIRTEQNLGDLQPQVTPGVQLVSIGKRKRKASPERPIKKTEGAVEEVKSPNVRSDTAPAVSKPKLLKLEQGTSDPQRVTCRLCCQNCNNDVQYTSVKTYKTHVRGYDHKQCINRQFPQLRRSVRESRQTKDPIPSFDVYSSLMNPNRTDPIIGVHLLTVCITNSVQPAVYLCHGCGEALSSRDSVRHLTSTDHYFNTLAHDDPESLPFGWLPSHDARGVLKPKAGSEEKKCGNVVLQVLYLPQELFMEVKSALYSTAMKTILRMGDVMDSLKVKHIVTLPKYLSTPKRKHPLLGLQFLVQYHSAGTNGSSEFLCLLCQKRLRQSQGVAHVISFDHIFSYLECAHPLSLGNKSDHKHDGAEYKATILDLASQAEVADTPGEIREVPLGPDVYEAVCQSSFANALNKLETAWSTLNRGELRPQVTPGERLVVTKAPNSQEDHVTHKDHSVPVRAPVSDKGVEDLAVLHTTELDNEQPAAIAVCVNEAAVLPMRANNPRGSIVMVIEEKKIQTPVATPDPVQESLEVEHVTNNQEGTENPDTAQHLQEIEMDPVEGIAGVTVDTGMGEELQEGQVFHEAEKSPADVVFATQGYSECQKASPRPSQEPQWTKKETGPAKGRRGLHTSRASFQTLKYPETGPIGESNWAKFWFLDGRSYPAIGLEAIVECRCLKQPTFYLCLTCTEQIACSHICDHIISSRHQHYYIKSLYPELLRYWRDDPEDIAWLVYRHDRKWDVQVVKLHPASYQRVVSAPFFKEAVQMIREEQDQYEPRPLMMLEDEPDVTCTGKAWKQAVYRQEEQRGHVDGCDRQFESSSSTFEKKSMGTPCWRSQPRALDVPGGSPLHVHNRAWSPSLTTSPPSTSVCSGNGLMQTCVRRFPDGSDSRKSVSPERPAPAPLAGADPENPAEKVLIRWKEMTGREGRI